MDVIDKKIPKVNTLAIFGGAGAGKTFFVKSLTSLVWCYGVIESHINRSSAFPYEMIYGKRMGLINEFSCSQSQVDNIKDLFEGNNLVINIKYRPHTTIKRTPIFITSNSDILKQFTDGVHRQAIQQRIRIYNWRAQPWLAELEKQIHPMVWMKLAAIQEDDEEFFDDAKDIEDMIEVAKSEHEERSNITADNTTILNNIYESFINKKK